MTSSWCKQSFTRLVPMQDAIAEFFYDRLFEVAPKLRELFPSDLRHQKRKLMQMIATAVGGCESISIRSSQRSKRLARAIPAMA